MERLKEIDKILGGSKVLSEAQVGRVLTFLGALPDEKQRHLCDVFLADSETVIGLLEANVSRIERAGKSGNDILVGKYLNGLMKDARDSVGIIEEETLLGNSNLGFQR